MFKRLTVLVSVLALWSRQAYATFSIAAVDTLTDTIGAAACTCIPSSGFSIYNALYRTVPGKAVLVTQGLVQSKTSPANVLAAKLMSNNTEPSQILNAIATPTVDSGSSLYGSKRLMNYRLRQYGLVDFQGRAAAYSGSELATLYSILGYAPSEQTSNTSTVADTRRFFYSAQGNVVADGTVSLLAAAFNGEVKEYGKGCDLADRLFTAVNAVAKAGLGDVRCTGTAGTIAFIHVDDAKGNALLHIDILYSSSDPDPFNRLRTQYEKWRLNHPCPIKCRRKFANETRAEWKAACIAERQQNATAA